MYTKGEGPIGGRLLASTALVLLSAAIPSVTARAQTSSSGGGVETITVTAEKRSENIQSVPMAVSAVGGDTLEQLGISNVADLAPFLPNFSVVARTNNARDISVIIRNTGSSGTNPGIEPDVGVFIDGVYEPAGGALIGNLVDIQDVEVLYGPQGTLYGRNTVVGALNVTTRVPTQEEQAYVDVTLGNYGAQRVQGYFGGGIADDLAGRLSFYEDSNSGYEHNIATGASIDGQQEYGGRGRVRWTPDSKLTVDFIGAYDLINSNCCAATIIDPYGRNGIVTQNPGFLAAEAAAGQPFVAPNYNRHDVDVVNIPNNQTQIGDASVNAQLELPWGDTLTSVSGYTLFINDLYEQPGWSLPIDIGTSSQFESEAGYSEELRLASKTGGFLEYLFGLYGFYQETHYGTGGVLGTGATRIYPALTLNGVVNGVTYHNLHLSLAQSQTAPGDTTTLNFGQWTQSGAAFGQVKISPLDDLHLIAGGRFSYTNKQAETVQTTPTTDSYQYQSGTPSSNTGLLRYSSKGALTWLLTAQYDITGEIMAYATVATGFKDGGFNARAAKPGGAFVPLTFGPETSENYEVGFKSAFFDNHVVFDADIFRQWIHGYQQSEFDSALPPNGGFIVGNAGDLQTQGYEATLTAQPIDNLTITGNIGLASERIYNSPPEQCSGYLPLPEPLVSASAGTCNYNGLTPAYAPRVHWAIDGEWTHTLTSTLDFYLGSDIDWQGSQYELQSLDPPTYQSAVALLNARIGVQSKSGNWRVLLWGRNLLDQTYFTAETTQPQPANIGGASPLATAQASGEGPLKGGYVGWYGEPRTFGIEATYQF